MICSKEMQDYFDKIQREVDKCYEIATISRKKNLDPENYVDITLAKNMAERVEGLISTVYPNIKKSGITDRILELEKIYSPLDWRVALVIALEVAQEKFCKFNDKKEAIEVGIRTGFAYQTGGIVSAPLEGFVELRIKKRMDGKEYFAPCYAGPIRGAGGTAAAFSLLITDYVRIKLGYSRYDPSEDEILRYVTELYDYHERVTNLQYLPSEDEIKFLVSNIPVEIDGDPTEKFEVSNHKDIPRINTNLIRGGICLVLGEGLAQKAPKIWKRLEKWGKDFDFEWDFLKDFLELQKKIKSMEKKTDEKRKITPNYTYIKDLVAGRPILTHPMRPGGFRLRYGRSRFSGFSAASIHPATMVLLDGYIATGTQLKVERPGKGAAITPNDSIDGPIVELEDGTVKKINSISLAKECKEKLNKILYLGDILFNYGDFSENGHVLCKPGYNNDWFKLECREKNIIPPQTFEENVILSSAHKIPLSPQYTFFWSLIKSDDLICLLDWMKHSNFFYDNNNIIKITLSYKEKEKKILNILGVQHIVVNREYIVLESDESKILTTVLQIKDKSAIKDIIDNIKKYNEEGKTILDILNLISPMEIRDTAGTFIGARMGRPEKAKMRKLKGSPHTLFPVGDEGGRLRSLVAALGEKKITADFPIRYCNTCKKETISFRCMECDNVTEQLYYCKKCGKLNGPKCIHGKGLRYKHQVLPICEYFENALKIINMKDYPELIKGVRGTSSEHHIPEHFIKGILRSKYDLYVNKDGTIRFDMSELPITHFRPKEIGVEIHKLLELGYSADVYGKPITSTDQLVELKVQDLIIPAGEALDEQADKVLLRTTKFIDELLEKFYNLPSYYNINKKEELIGHLVIGLAPHISAGMVGRILGFSRTQGMLAHPLFHAAMRRDCDGDEASISLLLDGFLNFSSNYLPNTRGAKTMDAPLVLTSILTPSEVDDQVHGLDVVWEYPKEFYEAASQYKYPWEISIEQINKRLGTEKQYEGMGFTHDITDINLGINCSSYKLLPSMEEKLNGQMKLARIISAVDEEDVARLVIEKHFLKDIKGNLRKYSRQKFRCVNCNESFRRPPLKRDCTSCGGKIIFTISEGSVIKYLQLTLNIAKNYAVSTYLKQVLMLLEREIETVFGKETEKQEGLNKWFNR